MLGSVSFPVVNAIFTADTENPDSTAAGGWIPAPSGTSDVVGGAANEERDLTWTSGASAGSPSPNPVAGQTILAADGGSGSSASCGSYTAIATPTAGDTTYADSASTPAADWWCYAVVSDSAGSWTSDVVAFPPIRLLVPISATLAEGGGHAGGIENGDTITITYNQDVKAAGTTIAIRACKNQGTIVIGSTCGGAPSVGEITGVTVPSNSAFTSSTWVVTGPTIVFTLAGSGHPCRQPRSSLRNKVKATADNTLVCGGQLPADE